MTMIKLEECREVDPFLDTIASQETKATYAYHRKQFEEAGGKYDEETIMKYLQAMKDHKYSYASVNNARSAIRHYCDSKRIRLDWDRISEIMGRKSYANKKLRAYTREEIKKMLEIADPKMRAVILLLASTGQILSTYLMKNCIKLQSTPVLMKNTFVSPHQKLPKQLTRFAAAAKVNISTI